MKGIIEDFKTGWYGVSIGLTSIEIEKLIDLLQKLKKNEVNHFHFRNSYTEPGGLADVEISIKGPEDSDNLALD